MRLLTTLFVTGFTALAAASAAQTTLPYDHVHLAAPDQAKAVDWYQKNFGGERSPEGKDRLFYGKTRFIWLKAEAAKPSEGGAIDHIGFSYRDADAKVKELAAAGAKIVSPVREVGGVIKFGMVEDPWGVKIEILEDADHLGFHHVHLRATDPAATMAWFKQRFGGESTTVKGRIDAIKYGDMFVMVQKANTAPAPSVGRALDHVGWRVPDLDKILADLKGIKVLQPRTDLQLGTGMVHYSFVEDPGGIKIELVQR